MEKQISRAKKCEAAVKIARERVTAELKRKQDEGAKKLKELEARKLSIGTHHNIIGFEITHVHVAVPPTDESKVNSDEYNAGQVLCLFNGGVHNDPVLTR